MGFFSRKKPEQKKELPPLKFPEIPDSSKIPTYESSIKEAVKKETIEDMEFPSLEPQRIEASIKLPPMTIQKEHKLPNLPPMHKEHFFREPRLEEVEHTLERIPQSREEEKVLFIKIDRYEEVLDTVKSIKSQLAEAEKTLMKLENTYSEEERQIELWKKDLEQIKAKIANIDKKLYTI